MVSWYTDGRHSRQELADGALLIRGWVRQPFDASSSRGLCKWGWRTWIGREHARLENILLYVKGLADGADFFSFEPLGQPMHSQVEIFVVSGCFGVLHPVGGALDRKI